MPIGAIIGGVASIGGALASSSSNNRAINNATEATTQANDQALRVAQEARNDNRQILEPFFEGGYAANNQLNALLGLGGNPQTSNNRGQVDLSQFQGLSPNGSASQFGSQFNNNAFNRFSPNQFGGEQIGQFSNPQFTQNVQQQIGSSQFGAPQQQPVNALAPQVGQTSQQAANDAFQQFRDNTGYQFNLNEGLDAVRSSYAGGGAFQSGAAAKSLQDRGSSIADNSFLNYAGLLQNQQGAGLSAGSALAGVNTNFASNAGQLAQANGAAQTNAGFLRANNSNALIGGITGAVGGLLGG